MNLEEKLRQLRTAAQPSASDVELRRQLEYLRRAGQIPRALPARRVPRGIEEYVDGRVDRNSHGEFFLAQQALPFGRPYGKRRIADVWAADLSPLNLFLESATLPASSQLLYLDTETTGLAGGTGTCAFLLGVGTLEGSQFVVRQFFLRDYPEEKAMLAALSERLGNYEGLVTFNGKTFDVPLLETRYAMARLKSPFTRLVHLDLLHPARRLWKLRLESCQLTNLEKKVLAVGRQGDVPGSEIPGIYFDYLRTGNARGLQPVFYHNSLDIISLATLTVELARAVGDAGAQSLDSSLDLFSLSRIFERAGATEESVSICRRAIEAGLPRSVEARALWQLASQHKRQRQYQQAVEVWEELTRRRGEYTIEACEELAIHFEHRERDVRAALRFAQAGAGFLHEKLAKGCDPQLTECFRRSQHRIQRLQRKIVSFFA